MFGIDPFSTFPYAATAPGEPQIAELASASDAPSALGSFGEPTADSAAVADAPSALGSFGEPAGDSATAGGVFSATISARGLFADSATGTDAPSRTFETDAGFTDLVTVADSQPTTQIAADCRILEEVDLSSRITSTFTYTNTVAEGATITDVPRGGQTYQIDVEDGMEALDDPASEFLWNLVVDTEPPPETGWQLVET